MLIVERSRIEINFNQFRYYGTANSIISTLKGEYKTFYRAEKLQKWDSNCGQNLRGSFNAAYYSGLLRGKHLFLDKRTKQ